MVLGPAWLSVGMEHRQIHVFNYLQERSQADVVWRCV